MIALGVLAAAWIFSRRFAGRGHSSDLATSVTIWAVVAGLIGARAYHVITDWRTYQDNWGESWQIWEGGLGIPGAVMAAAAALWVFAKRKKIPLSDIADSVAPALPLGQAIGRWGNWFNQELYGRPTDLPWGLEIDLANRRPDYTDQDTFHPTFLYEGLWNLALMGFLFWASKRFSLKPGRLFGLYVLGYSLGRIWLETIRVDYASELAGVRINIWVMLVLAIGSTAYLRAKPRQQSSDISDEELGTSDDEPDTSGDEPEDGSEDNALDTKLDNGSDELDDEPDTSGDEPEDGSEELEAESENIASTN